MSRAVFLPTPGDPFLVSYWLRQYEQWRDLVDKLYVYISWPQEPEVIDRLRADIEAVGGICVRAVSQGTRHEHGQALEEMLALCGEDVIFMAEDDLYVQDRHAFAAYFEQVEREGCVIGRSRGSMSMEIVNATKERYPNGAALWPFVFARTRALRSLTERFGARWWAAGEEVKGIDHTCEEACNADTFGAASMEIRGRFTVVEGAIPTIWGSGPWFHVGSLSSGPATDDYEHVRSAAWSWRTRLEWWERFYEQWPGGLERQHAEYGQALDRLRATLR